jgi:hypothetical protein
LVDLLLMTIEEVKAMASLMVGEGAISTMSGWQAGLMGRRRRKKNVDEEG